MRGWVMESTAAIAAPWLPGVQITATPDDWRAAWPQIVARDGWACLKAGRNGTVHRGTLRLGGGEVDVVVKEPRRSRPSQWVIDCFRRNRARRSWYRTRRIVGEGFAAEIPLLLAERRIVGPLAIEQLAVFLAVPGTKLDAIDLRTLADRAAVFRSIGRVLGELSRRGFEHRDAKAPNWIICQGTPVMVDCDAIVRGRDRQRGLERFLRSFDLLKHPDSADARAVREGFAAS